MLNNPLYLITDINTAGGTIMWWKILIICLVFGMISVNCDEKIEKRPDKKRLYKFLMGLTYLITAAASLFLAQYLGDIIYIYTIGGVVFGIGSFLAAINSNLREIYAMVIFCGTIMWIISLFWDNHKTLFTIIDVCIIIGMLSNVKESIDNMRNGIDPDIIAEEKRKTRKILKTGFKIARMAMGIWFR